MTSLLKSRHRGFSLVELMVGMVIGLVAIMVVTQVAVTFEAQKRSTVGGAESMDTGMVALFSMKREIQKAGYGIADRDLVGCLVQGYDESPDDPPKAQAFHFQIYPIIIGNGGPGNSDSISINFANSPLLTAATTLVTEYTGDDSNLVLTQRYGFAVGDRIIIAEPTPADPATPRLDCSMRQITGLPIAGDVTPPDPAREREIRHKSEVYTNAFGSVVKSQFNKTGGMGTTILSVPTTQTYPANKTKVFDIGNNPVSNSYSVVDGKLVFVNGYSGVAKQTELLDNIVIFRAQYGFDRRTTARSNVVVTPADFSDTIIDANGNGFVGDADDYLRIGAVRIAFVVRNRYADTPDRSTGECTATTSSTQSWSWGSVDVSGLPDWKCYRYKAFETVIPLRNMLWTNEPPT